MRYVYYAAKLTDENVDEMVKFGLDHQFTLDHLKDNMEYNAEDGFCTYLILQTFEDDVVATFNDITSDAFDGTWQFGTNTTGPFTQIVRI